MTKCITINSCRECPYAYCDSKAWGIYTCTHSNFTIIDKLGAELPDTIHPDCKLNDVPSVADINIESLSNTNGSGHIPFRHGANFVINKLTK